MHPLAARFLAPANPVHRQYEALRAHYVDGLSVAEAAAKFHYAPGSFRNLLARFKRSPDRAFFLTNPPGPKLSSSRPDGRRRDARIVELRQKLRLSVAEIEDRLQAEGLPASSKTVLNVLRAHGFGKLSRRQWHSLSGGGLRYRFARLENRSASHFFLLGLQRSSGLRVTRG